MKAYHTKAKKLTGSDFREVNKKAILIFKKIRRGSKRRPYVRSKFFNKEKIFLDLFWKHLFEKPNWRDRVRRIKYFPPAIELIQNSRFQPESKRNPNKNSEILYRFTGKTPENNTFLVQIKEDTKTHQKSLISIFPYK
jgi:hypothetical protein